MISDYDWRFKDECFEKRSKLMGILIKLGVVLTTDVYEFCDFTLSQGWNPSEKNGGDQVLDMYHRYLREVRNV